MLNKGNAEKLTTVFTGIVAPTRLLALGLVYRQLRQDHEEDQVQHLVLLNKQYDQEPMVTCRKVSATKKLAGIDATLEEERLLDFFETVGTSCRVSYQKWMLFLRW